MSEALSLDQAASLVSALESPQEEAPVTEETNAPEAELPESSPEPEAELPEEADSEDEGDDQGESWLITVDGEELELSSAQIVELAQKGKDYTQKTQRVAEERREVEAAQEKIKQAALSLKQQRDSFEREMSLKNELYEQNAQLKGIEAQLGQYDKVDWNALRQQDFESYQYHRNQMQDLREARNGLKSDIQSKQTEISQKWQATIAEQVRESEAELKRDLNWNADLQTTLNDYISKHGLADEPIINAKLIKLIHKAYQFDQLNEGKDIVKNKVKSLPKVVKGRKQIQTPKQTERQKTRDRLRKSGDWRDALALISGD